MAKVSLQDLHEKNRQSWDQVASYWHKNIYTDRWKIAPETPSLILLEEEREFLGDVSGKELCVLGSGNSVRDFALAGLGAKVTAVDISQVQLDIASKKARKLGVDMHFLRADVTDLRELSDKSFDVVYTSMHVATWLSDLSRYIHEAGRILKNGGKLLINEIHPLARFAEVTQGLDAPNYYHKGPYEIDRSRESESSPETITGYEFLWTIEDYIMGLLNAGFRLTGIMEYGSPKVEQDSIRAARNQSPKCLLLTAIKEER